MLYNIETQSNQLLKTYLHHRDEYIKYPTQNYYMHQHRSEQEILKLIKLGLHTISVQELIYGEDHLIPKE